MHLAAILFGAFLFCNGVTTLVLGGMFIDAASLDDRFREPGQRRWAPYVAAVVMLPLPIGLVLGGGELVRWGFFGG
jgi:threonine/homoserine/homoserine lactone efflux protein